jgi:hypothetical protein
MTMLSTAAIEAMGFREMEAGESIVAAFHSLNVYEVRGFTLSDDAVVSSEGTVAGASYRMTVGSSVNAICRALFGDDFVEDEGQWAREHKCTPPYVVVHIGPTEVHACDSGFIKDEEAEVLVYNGFPRARGELHALEELVLPSVESALACVPWMEGHVVRFVPVSREAFGLTTDHTVVHDVRVVAKAEGYSSLALPTETASDFLASAAALSGSLNEKVARFYQLGLRDKDPLKRFLYFFLAVEIYTHKAFGTIEDSDQLRSLLNVPERVSGGVTRLLEGNRSTWRNLLDRFIWCSLCVWPHVTDTHIEIFQRLQRTRNEIAHGVLAIPLGADVRAIEELTTTLLRVPD